MSDEGQVEKNIDEQAQTEKGTNFGKLNQAKREAVYQKTAPPAAPEPPPLTDKDIDLTGEPLGADGNPMDPDDLKSVLDESVASFRNRHPEVSDADWKAMGEKDFWKGNREIVDLRKKVFANPTEEGLAELFGKVYREYQPTKQKNDGKGYVRTMQRQRNPLYASFDEYLKQKAHAR